MGLDETIAKQDTSIDGLDVTVEVIDFTKARTRSTGDIDQYKVKTTVNGQSFENTINQSKVGGFTSKLFNRPSSLNEFVVDSVYKAIESYNNSVDDSIQKEIEAAIDNLG